MPETHEDGVEVELLQKEYASVKANLEDAYRKWEEAQLEFEELVGQIDTGSVKLEICQ